MNQKNLIIFILVIACSGLVYWQFGSEKKETFLLPQEAVDLALAYINNNFLSEGAKATLAGDIKEESGLYKFEVEVAGEKIPTYVTKNGKFLFPESQVFFIKEEAEEEAVKKEMPDVKLFVMSYCPFGLQAEKGFLPVYNLLKDKAEMGVYFVDYIMHGKEEIDENLRQYCLQKEEEEKFVAYLGCFVKEGDYQKCLTEAGINQAKLTACQEATNEEYQITALYEDESTWRSARYPQFNVHTDLNEKYGVRGSPTFVINDKVVEVGRAPEAIKKVVCQAFAKEPEECSTTLSQETPSPGFGEGSGSSGSGQCK